MNREKLQGYLESLKGQEGTDAVYIPVETMIAILEAILEPTLLEP